MSTRSPMNKRNQNREGVGMTRKSAGSAKPARTAAASVTVVPASAKEKRRQAERGEDLSKLSKEEKKARKDAIRRKEDRIYAAANVLMREDENYVKNRRFFWYIMAAGVVCIGIGWALLVFGQSMFEGEMQSLPLVFVAISYVCIIGAFIYDMVRIRPIRNRCRATVEGMSENKLANTIARGEEAANKRRAEREAKKLARKNK